MKKKKKTDKSRNPRRKFTLPIEVIAAASSGDVEAVEKVLKHFEGYIAVLSTRTFYDENGAPCLFVDGEKRRRLEIKLITNLVKYSVASPANL